MPALDMPLEKLKNYGGINPKPADFDAFWAEGLAETAKTDPKTTFAPATGIRYDNFETNDLYFDSVKNSRIYAKYVRSSGVTGKQPVLLLLHGYGGSSGDWFDKTAWAAQGYIVLAMDCRGQAGKSEDYNPVKGTTQSGLIMRGFGDPDPKNMYFRNVFLDTVQLVKVAKSLPGADADRIYAYGGSQGGALTIACAALNGSDVKKAVALHPFLSDYKRVWEMDLAVDAYGDVLDYIRKHAPVPSAQDAVWEKLGYIDIQHLAPRITADVLWLTGLMDNICPPSSQFAAYNKITSKKDIIIYTNQRHEGLPNWESSVIPFLNGRK
ncbi:MAG: acetylxylan esterase [Clostridiales bacterium]|jgi:cephalosporin-C deacetylase|nr:acetylxylan esterase [Clostridiales bacterium]